MTSRNIRVIEWCQDDLAVNWEDQWSVRMGTVVGQRTIAIRDDEKLNLFTLPQPIPQDADGVDVTDIHCSWIYLSEEGKQMSAEKLARMSVIELAPYVA
ncbi:hypothetical protein M3221_00425 [Domibacillus indicus]|uniref:hypothetical protein n=1 Tax=Domibacillus indicus TaxID=1437523 RepID=UPI0020413E06|nr:hypothetical protein [Domibacillus indicus]MCM3786895.1 hypothetical protein [Domibacillus indicus]